MEKLTLVEFLTLPSLDFSSFVKLFKNKKWLTIGENPYRRELREWVYESGDVKNFFEYRNSKKNGESWSNRILENKGEFDKIKQDILDKGFKLTHLDKDEFSQNNYFENNSLSLTLKQFNDFVGRECFHLILKVNSTNKESSV